MPELSLNNRLAEIVSACKLAVEPTELSDWAMLHAASRIDKIGHATADAAAQLVRKGFPGKAEELANYYRGLKTQTEFSLAADAIAPMEREALKQGLRRHLQQLGNEADYILATSAVADSTETAGGEQGDQDCESDTDSQPLTKEEVSALLFMKDRYPVLCTLDDFESATPLSLSRRTAQEVRTALISAGYAESPKPRKGMTLTEKGRRTAARLRTKL